MLPVFASSRVPVCLPTCLRDQANVGIPTTVLLTYLPTYLLAQRERARNTRDMSPLTCPYLNLIVIPA